MHPQRSGSFRSFFWLSNSLSDSGPLCISIASEFDGCRSGFLFAFEDSFGTQPELEHYCDCFMHFDLNLLSYATFCMLLKAAAQFTCDTSLAMCPPRCCLMAEQVPAQVVTGHVPVVETEQPCSCSASFLPACALTWTKPTDFCWNPTCARA